MSRKPGVMLLLIVVVLLNSCNNKSEKKDTTDINVQNKILQQEDGTISLKVDIAECYHDMVNPSSNTAEWDIVVSKSGRFNVWLSSATTDTTDLQYQNSVMVSLLDDRLEARPVCDKILPNSSDVKLPYYRADSYMGQVYIQNPGEYIIQLISEKVIPKNNQNDASLIMNKSKLLSVILTPMTR
jgi:hypothetical protein